MNPHQPRDPKDQGYSAGNPGNGISAGKAILISAVSAVAGAFMIRLMDRTVFSKDKQQIEGLQAELAARAGARALPPAQPQARPGALPPPGYVRIDVPKETMTDEFWARLAGDVE
jgi:hypothetical protein